MEICTADGISKAVVRVEIADTAAARQLGLMYRQHLAPNSGMLFVFKLPQHLTFWMKNTEIPLDMIFADANGTVIGLVQSAEPFSQAQLSVSGASQYVLEVNGGFAERQGIKAGDRFRFLDLRPSAKD